MFGYVKLNDIKGKIVFTRADTYGSMPKINALYNGIKLDSCYVDMETLFPLQWDELQILRKAVKAFRDSAEAKKKSDTGTSSIWHVLGCMPTTDKNVVEKAYRKMTMVYHPDAGGTSKAFQTLTDAKEKALAKCK